MEPKQIKEQEIKQRIRSEIPTEFKWRINDLIESDHVWQNAMDTLTGRIEGLARFKGRLAQDGILLKCLTEQAAISEEFSKLYVYANMKLHEDTNDTTYQGFVDMASTIHIRLMAAESFIEPEILTLKNFPPEPGLEIFRHFLENLMRQKNHILSPETEEILAQAHVLGEAPDNIFSMFDNADIKFGTITDDKGNRMELTHSRYGAMLESPNREVRKNAWNTFYDSYWYLKNTLAAAYSASVKKDVFFSKIRKYPSAMDAALFSNNIPLQVYTGLIETVHEYLPKLHQYMELRKKVLGLTDLKVYDLYTPMVKDVNDRIEYKEAVDTVLKSIAPLGEEYTSAAKAGLNGGWVDVYENAGKMNGAYSWGAYGGHPYILLNYENKMDDMFTLAHELGHAMHSYYSWKTQPYVYSDYSIFLAEVASTVNEALLMEHLLKNNENPAMKAFLINTWLEQFRTTVFRQTLFAEFEMISHRMAEEGEPLTVETLNNVYRALNEKYYGNVISLEDKSDSEWARIPHFYRAFYVYQYATGYSCAMAFAKRILEDGANGNEASQKYLEFLKSGSSGYPIEILKKAGVDMSGPEPVRDALDKFGDLLDQMTEM